MSTKLDNLSSNSQDNLSSDLSFNVLNKFDMDKLSKTEAHDAIRARTKSARKAKGLTQEAMAQLLEINDPDTYAKYENRSILPTELVAAFCNICGISAEDLLGIDSAEFEMFLLKDDEKREMQERRELSAQEQEVYRAMHKTMIQTIKAARKG